MSSLLHASNPTHFVTTLAGVQMPKMIYGTAWKKERTAEMVKKALLAGFRGIDTACQPKHYQEQLVGEGIQMAIQHLKQQQQNTNTTTTTSTLSRESLFLQTKFTSLDGQDPHRIPYDPIADLPTQIRQSFALSLKNLQTSYLDSLVLHSPLHPFGLTLVAWKEMEELVKEGKVRQLGISNIYNLKELKLLWNESKIKPAVVQNRFYRETNYDREIRQFCNQSGIIYQSFWTLTANPNVIKQPMVREIAERKGKTAEQVFFRFVMQLGIVPLTGTTDEQHMKVDLDVMDFELTADEMQEIKQLIGE